MILDVACDTYVTKPNNLLDNKKKCLGSNDRLGLKGDYVLNPDSLRLHFCDKNIKVGRSFPFSETNTYKNNNTHVKNRILSIQLRYERQDKGDEDSLALSILPSDFLMCNEKRVLTDSLRIVLKKAKRK